MVLSNLRSAKVATKYHLAGCVIEKNFSTMLTAILCYLFDETRFTKHKRNLTAEMYHKRFCEAQNEHDSLTNLRSELKVVDLKGWSLIAVVRDPLERFVSGFANKCLRRCEFNSHLHEYQVLKFDTFNPRGFIDKLLTILKKHKVSEKSINFIRTSVASGRTSHSTKDSVERQETKNTILSSEYLTDLLIKMYFYDFVLFGFPIPEATYDE
ncbi:hypothetical protein ANCCAN_08135 [Ancylostoma caninum]|uniref:Carbohydrate sulfotransferase n=1 Tax=Ancylostoma caninum TaxID=29170 RepID=A0A368GQG1_ANCCA|nr:hypothetical protein ANCCAN_08135 [Ancylostoma caninum]